MLTLKTNFSPAFLLKFSPTGAKVSVSSAALQVVPVLPASVSETGTSRQTKVADTVTASVGMVNLLSVTVTVPPPCFVTVKLPS